MTATVRRIACRSIDALVTQFLLREIASGHQANSAESLQQCHTVTSNSEPTSCCLCDAQKVSEPA